MINVVNQQIQQFEDNEFNVTELMKEEIKTISSEFKKFILSDKSDEDKSVFVFEGKVKSYCSRFSDVMSTCSFDRKFKDLMSSFMFNQFEEIFPFFSIMYRLKYDLRNRISYYHGAVDGFYSSYLYKYNLLCMPVLENNVDLEAIPPSALVFFNSNEEFIQENISNFNGDVIVLIKRSFKFPEIPGFEVKYKKFFCLYSGREHCYYYTYHRIKRDQQNVYYKYYRAFMTNPDISSTSKELFTAFFIKRDLTEYIEKCSFKNPRELYSKLLKAKQEYNSLRNKN